MSRKTSSPFGNSKNGKTKGDGAAALLSKGPQKLLADTLALVVNSGAAIMLGATRDGNTLVVTLLDGDVREKQYCEDLDSWRQALTDLAAWATPDTGLPF